MATATPPQQAPAPDATQAPDRLFRYSAWVHVGAGAAECEHAETGGCKDPAHFHAWCRLPNQLQHQDIRERALAAKARRIRQLRDPEADASAVLESDIEELRRVASREDLADELARKDWWKRQLDAMSDVGARDEFEHIDRDRDRLNELRGMDPDDRPADEYEELERQLGRYSDAVEAAADELEKPVRASLERLKTAELIAQVREERISSEASAAFMDTYSNYSWLAGTFTSNSPTGRQRSFASMELLADAAPEVLEALRATFADLEAALQRGPQGN